MHVTIRIEADVDRESGPFASREEIEEALLEAANDADPGQVDTEGGEYGGVYQVTSWEAEAEEQSKRRKPAIGLDHAELLRRLDRLFNAYGAPPDGLRPAPYSTAWVDALDREMSALMSLVGLGPAIGKAKRRRA